MIKVGIAGACGKMGRRIGSLALKDPEVELSAAVELAEVSAVAPLSIGGVSGEASSHDLARLHQRVELL